MRKEKNCLSELVPLKGDSTNFKQLFIQVPCLNFCRMNGLLLDQLWQVHAHKIRYDFFLGLEQIQLLEINQFPLDLTKNWSKLIVRSSPLTPR